MNGKHVIAIDPGPLTSALVVMDGPRSIVEAMIVDNASAREFVAFHRHERPVYAIEYTPPYTLTMGGGRAYVPRQVVDTAIEIGRLWECAADGPVSLVSRLDVKKHLLGRATGGDPDVRAALLDCWGCRSTREAKGTAKAPGPLAAITKDLWAALGVGVTFWETRLARQ